MCFSMPACMSAVTTLGTKSGAPCSLRRPSSQPASAAQTKTATDIAVRQLLDDLSMCRRMPPLSRHHFGCSPAGCSDVVGCFLAGCSDVVGCSSVGCSLAGCSDADGCSSDAGSVFAGCSPDGCSDADGCSSDAGSVFDGCSPDGCVSPSPQPIRTSGIIAAAKNTSKAFQTRLILLIVLRLSSTGTSQMSSRPRPPRASRVTTGPRSIEGIHGLGARQFSPILAIQLKSRRRFPPMLRGMTEESLRDL